MCCESIATVDSSCTGQCGRASFSVKCRAAQPAAYHWQIQHFEAEVEKWFEAECISLGGHVGSEMVATVSCRLLEILSSPIVVFASDRILSMMVLELRRSPCIVVGCVCIEAENGIGMIVPDAVDFLLRHDTVRS
jgi:hypothetical protein